MAGRKPLPDAVKALTGTLQPCRTNPAAPAGLPDRPGAPAWLCDRGAEIFEGYVRVLEDMGLASASDAAMLGLLASRSVEVEELSATIATEGRTYQTVGNSGVMHRTRPEVSQLRDAMRHVQTLLAEFGLSPAARSRVSAAKGGQENEFDDL
jgi:P27 family predicted phage terminase small subunit